MKSLVDDLPASDQNSVYDGALAPTPQPQSDGRTWARWGATVALSQVLVTGLAMSVSLGKESVLARVFGLSPDFDAFVIALFIPSFIATQSGLAVNSALTPSFARLRERGEIHEANRLLARAVLGMALLLAIVAAASAVFAPACLHVLAPSLRGGRFGATVRLLRLLAPYTMLGAMASIFSTVVAALGKPLAAAWTPMAVPIVVATAAFAITPAVGVDSLAIGTVVGSLIQVGLLLMLLKRNGAAFAIDRRPVQGLGRVTSEWIYALFAGLLIAAANGLDILTLSSLPSGSLAALRYATRVVALPLTLGHGVIAYLAYPMLCRSMGDAARSRAVLRRTLCGLAILAAPFMLLMWFWASPLVGLLFQHGVFGRANTRLVGKVASVLALNLCGELVVMLMYKAFAAAGKNRTLVLAALMGLCVKAILNPLLARHFGVPGVAWATLADYACQLGLLTVVVRGPLAGHSPPIMASAFCRTDGAHVSAEGA